MREHQKMFNRTLFRWCEAICATPGWNWYDGAQLDKYPSHGTFFRENAITLSPILILLVMLMKWYDSAVDNYCYTVVPNTANFYLPEHFSLTLVATVYCLWTGMIFYRTLSTGIIPPTEERREGREWGRYPDSFVFCILYFAFCSLHFGSVVLGNL